jgi:hypothetical protein
MSATSDVAKAVGGVLALVDGPFPFGDIFGLVIVGTFVLYDIYESSKNNSAPANSLIGGSSPATPPEDPNDRKFNVNKSESEQWQKLDNVKNSKYRSSGKGANKQYYDWDYTHNDIEVYDKLGNHLGSMNPVTGEMYKPPVPGRTIKLP